MRWPQAAARTKKTYLRALYYRIMGRRGKNRAVVAVARTILQIAYHVITEGRCFANIIGDDPIAIEAGEVIVFTRGDPHVLSSSPGMRADLGPSDKLKTLGGSQLPFLINYGGDGPTSAKLVCGSSPAMPWPFNPLLHNLPSIIKVADAQGSDMRWLGRFIRVATIESADKRAAEKASLRN